VAAIIAIVETWIRVREPLFRRVGALFGRK